MPYSHICTIHSDASLMYINTTHVYVRVPRYHSCIYPYALFARMHNTLRYITHVYIHHPCIYSYAEISLMYISVCLDHTYAQHTRIYHSRIYQYAYRLGASPYSHVCHDPLTRMTYLIHMCSCACVFVCVCAFLVSRSHRASME